MKATHALNLLNIGLASGFAVWSRSASFPFTIPYSRAGVLHNNNHVTPCSTTRLSALIIMPDGTKLTDDEDQESYIETTSREEQTLDALLQHLNQPDLRGYLAVIAAAAEDIDPRSIQQIRVSAVTPQTIDIESICSRDGDDRCINILASVDLPHECRDDREVLTALNGLYQKAQAKLDRKEVKAGEVVTFNPKRGYGFISMGDDSDSGDVFVHHCNVVMEGYRRLRAGERVEFRVGTDTRRGTGRLYAYDVRPIAPPVDASDYTEDDGNSIRYGDAVQLEYEESGDETVMTIDDFKAKCEADVVMESVTSKAKDSQSMEAATNGSKAKARDSTEAVSGKAEEKESESQDETRRLEQSLSKKAPLRNCESMEVGECAFQILLDLGLVELTPDLDAPNYDSSKDEEFAEYMCIQK